MSQAPENIDVNELFHRDPMKLTNEDIAQMVAVYRSKRKQFNTNPTQVKKPAAAKSPAAKAAAALNLDLKL